MVNQLEPLTPKQLADLERKIKRMDRLYPNLPFNPNPEDSDRLNKVFIKSTSATLFHPTCCYCCDPVADGGQIININRDRNIRYRDIYEECERQWTQELCDHRFLDGIIDCGDGVILMKFGS